MPLEMKAIAGDSGYASPMVGPVDHTVHGKIDLSTLTIAEVDADGYLKPGVILTESGGLLVPYTAAPTTPPLVVVEATKLNLVTIPPTNATLLTETGDHLIAVCTHGIVNRDIAEDNLGRVYHAANEVPAFNVAGSHLKLTTT